MAGRPKSKRSLDILMNGELVATWTYAPREGHSFAYVSSWLEKPIARSVSLSLPISQGTRPFTGQIVESFFNNLLPDSPNIRKRLALKFGAESDDAFQLLEKIGRDCAGAIQLLPHGVTTPDVNKVEAEPLSEKLIERILDDTVSKQRLGIAEEDELRISIAGAQEKTALLWHEGQWCMPRGATPTSHILKLPLGEVGGMRADFSTSVENEWLCGKILDAYGIPVAGSRIERFGRHKVLIVERFDRRLSDGRWLRLPQEDFCQVLGLPPEMKYENQGGPGMASILDRLRGSVNAELDRKNFLMAQLIFWMLAAPDGHAKNFSIFIGAKDRFKLTPLYDVMSAWPVIGKGAREFQLQKVKMAMALHTKSAHYKIIEIQRRHWNEVAKANAIGEDFEEVIQNVIAATPRVVEIVTMKLGRGFPERVSHKVLDGLVAQSKKLNDAPAKSV